MLMYLSKKQTYLIIFLSLVPALAIPLFIRLVPLPTRTHTIAFEAKKYGYSPSRIVVNKGDTVILKPTSLDVTHGFYLDGHPLEFIIKSQGITYLKYTWEDDKGKLNTDWDKVREVEFVAEKAGKFVFRCTQTCGNLHPFMSGELIVRPNTPYHLGISVSIWILFSFLLLFGHKTGIEASDRGRINLLKRFRWLNWLVERRSFHFAILFPSFLIFYLFVLSTLWGNPVGNRNISIIFVWVSCGVWPFWFSRVSFF